MTPKKAKGGQIKVYNPQALQDLLKQDLSNSASATGSFGQYRPNDMSFSRGKTHLSSATTHLAEDRRTAKERRYQQQREQIEKQRKVNT